MAVDFSLLFARSPSLDVVNNVFEHVKAMEDRKQRERLANQQAGLEQQRINLDADKWATEKPNAELQYQYNVDTYDARVEQERLKPAETRNQMAYRDATADIGYKNAATAAKQAENAQYEAYQEAERKNAADTYKRQQDQQQYELEQAELARKTQKDSDERRQFAVTSQAQAQRDQMDMAYKKAVMKAMNEKQNYNPWNPRNTGLDGRPKYYPPMLQNPFQG